MSHLTLVLGGIRSGKSAFAEQLAAQQGSRVLYVATGEGLDSEMQARIQQHRDRRPPTWTTIEAPRDPVGALQAAGAPCDAVLIESVSGWVANLMLNANRASQPSPVPGQGLTDTVIAGMVDGLIAWAEASPARTIMVSDEVGMALVAASSIGRRFQDLIGTMNQRIAAAAADVFLVAAGVPLALKQSELSRAKLAWGSAHDPNRG